MLETSDKRMATSDRARLQQVDVGPLRLTVATVEEAVAFTGRLVNQGGRHYLCFCEANLLSRSHEPRVADVLNLADATFADGIATLWLARLHGIRLPGRVPGPTFLLRACEHGLSHGWRHFFYGGQPGVAETLAGRLCEWFPGIHISGTYSPPFRDLDHLAEEDEVLRRIEDVGTDLLWVGLGGPKQEFWMAEHLQRVKVPVMLGVGAAFDFHAGNRAWAPTIVRRLGFEWAWRMATGGPATLKRNMYCVTKVAGMILHHAFDVRRRRQ